MITEAVREVCEMCEYTEGVDRSRISILGRRKKKWQKERSIRRLGIEGGLSVLGTRRNCRADE